jgi:DNA-binding response OmpR family regulator
MKTAIFLGHNPAVLDLARACLSDDWDTLVITDLDALDQRIGGDGSAVLVIDWQSGNPAWFSSALAKHCFSGPVVALAMNRAAVEAEALRLRADYVVDFSATPELYQAILEAWMRARGGFIQLRPAASFIPPPDSEAVDFLAMGSLFVDRTALQVYVDGSLISLRKKEAEVLDMLMRRPNQTVDRSLLLQEVWGDGFAGDGAVVDVTLSTLRKKLGPTGKDIITVRGKGYRLAVPHLEDAEDL